jgi:hypothetical protein
MSSASQEGDEESEDVGHEGRVGKLKAKGLSPDRAREFGQLLLECNIFTAGAPREFSESLPALVDTMFDTGTALGALQAKGFLANVRVRPRARASPLLL